MLEINTIQDFDNLNSHHRSAILKELKTKIRLEDWLRGQNNARNKRKRLRLANPKARAVEYVIEGTDKEVTARDGSDIHPSQITKCLKKIWMDCMDVEMDVPVYARDDNGRLVYADKGDPEPVITEYRRDRVPYYLLAEEYIEPRLQMIFDMGHAWHDVIQGYGKRGAWGPKKNYHEEVAIDPDASGVDGDIINSMAELYWIKGAVDAVISPYYLEVPGMGKVAIRVIHEYKTINSNGYSKLTKPKPDHMWQASIYSAVLDIPIVVYIYTNKDNCQMADFPVAFDHGLWQTIEAKIRKVQHLVNTNSVPDWSETSAVKNPRECAGCGYLKLCQPPQPEVAKLSARRR